MRSRNLLLGALAATAALLAGCSDPGPPLVTSGLGGDSGFDCGPSPLGQTQTFGSFVLINTGTTPVTVTSVKLTSARGLTMTKAWLMPQYKPPHGALSYVGDGFPFPPIHWPTWPDRQPIPGAVIKPHQELNLFFGVTRTTAATGRAGGPVITYTAGGNTYTLRERFGWVALAPLAHCPRTG